MEVGPGSAVVVRVGPRARRVMLGIALAGGSVLLLANLQPADTLLDADRGTFMGQAAVKVHQELDLGSEGNLATWWSSAMLGLVALTAFAVAAADGLRRGKRLAWCAAGALLLLLSADEVAKLHESLTLMVNAARGPGDQLPVGAGDWISILAPAIAVCALAVAVLPFYLLEGRRTAQLCVLAGLALWLASILFEAAEGGLVGVTLQPGRRELLEEGSELLGTALLLTAFLDPLVVRPHAAPSIAQGARLPAAEARVAVARAPVRGR